MPVLAVVPNGVIRCYDCVYFDFFEEAFNYIAYKDGREWMDTINKCHASVKEGMKCNTGKLLMVPYRPIGSEQE